MTEEEKTQLDNFCKENGISINSAMNKARELLMIDSLKLKAPDQSASIENFEVNLNSILSAYKIAVELSVNARKLAENEVKEELKALASLTQNNNTLQAENKDLSIKVSDLEKENNSLKIKITSLENQSKSISELEDELSNFKEKYADLKIKYSEDLEQLRNDNFNKIIEIVSSQNKRPYKKKEVTEQ